MVYNLIAKLPLFGGWTMPPAGRQAAREWIGAEVNMGIDDPNLNNRRVLLAEDEPILAELVREWLMDAGAIVVGPVASVDRALDLIDGEGTIDAAVLDVNLLDGKPIDPVLLKLASLGIPYLLVTGDISVVDKPWYWDRPCLDKPLSERAFIEAVEELV